MSDNELHEWMRGTSKARHGLDPRTVITERTPEEEEMLAKARHTFAESIKIPCDQCGQGILEREDGPEGDILVCPECGSKFA